MHKRRITLFLGPVLLLGGTAFAQDLTIAGELEQRLERFGELLEGQREPSHTAGLYSPAESRQRPR